MYLLLNIKNIYCFDDLKKYNDLVKRNILSGLNVFSSNELYKNFSVIDNNLGSLNVLSIPTVAICGTSPRQGKFTLQLGLRRELKKVGISFHNLEPNHLHIFLDLIKCFHLAMVLT